MNNPGRSALGCLLGVHTESVGARISRFLWADSIVLGIVADAKRRIGPRFDRARLLELRPETARSGMQDAMDRDALDCPWLRMTGVTTNALHP